MIKHMSRAILEALRIILANMISSEASAEDIQKMKEIIASIQKDNES